MGQYRLSQDAKTDLARIYWYGVDVFGELQAEKYYRELTDHFDRLAASPYQYPAVEYIRPGYRRSVYGSDHIYYRIEADVVEIMRILGRQDVTERL